MLKSKKKKLLSIKLAGILCASLLAGCGAPGENATPEPTKAEVVSSTPAPAATQTPVSTSGLILPVSSASALSPTASPLPERQQVLVMEPGFKEYIAYREISPREGITVYINEKKLKPEYDYLSSRWAEQPEVIIRAGGRDYVLDCEYNLDFGDPVVMFKEGRYAGMECGEILSIALPVKELTDALSPLGDYEVYGREYVLDYRALAEGNPTETIPMKESIPGDGVELAVGFRMNKEGESVLALSIPQWNESSRQYWREGIFWYPGIELLEQESCSVFYEELSHFTDSGMGYRRVGIAVGNQMLCLGKFCNGIFFPDEENGYYDEHWEFDLEGGPGLQAWQPRPLEPEALLDLDGDGVAERLSYRMTGDPVRGSRFIVTINGVENELDEYQTDTLFGNYMFTASLDGKTTQLMVFHLGYGADKVLTVYSYINGVLRRAGQIENADSYCMEKKDGRWLYSVFEEISALQNDVVMLDYGLVDGILQEIPQEYYEFLMCRENEDGEPERNVLTAKQDFELYTEKGGEKTFILPAGSRVVTLGGDLADWILVENRDTKERGWLKVKGRRSDGPAGSYYTFTCVRSDGTEVDVEEVFEGMLIWG
ncbi:MAG: hypothetical protein K2N94_03855 [Lachnospiraceae bacterium]|nr:hypothetical protein [Lachnospiraceae bacterium]